MTFETVDHEGNLMSITVVNSNGVEVKVVTVIEVKVVIEVTKDKITEKLILKKFLLETFLLKPQKMMCMPFLSKLETSKISHY